MKKRIFSVFLTVAISLLSFPAFTVTSSAAASIGAVETCKPHIIADYEPPQQGVFLLSINNIPPDNSEITVGNVTYTANGFAAPINPINILISITDHLNDNDLKINGTDFTATMWGGTHIALIGYSSFSTVSNNISSFDNKITFSITQHIPYSSGTAPQAEKCTVRVAKPFAPGERIIIDGFTYVSQGGLTTQSEAAAIYSAFNGQLPNYNIAASGEELTFTQKQPGVDGTHKPCLIRVLAIGSIVEPLPVLRFNAETEHIEGFLFHPDGSRIRSIYPNNNISKNPFISGGTFVYALNYSPKKAKKIVWYPIFSDSLNVSKYLPKNEKDYRISIINLVDLQEYQRATAGASKSAAAAALEEFTMKANLGSIRLPNRAPTPAKSTFLYDTKSQALTGLVAPELGGNELGHEIRIQDSGWTDAVTFNSTLPLSPFYPLLTHSFQKNTAVEIRVQGLYQFPDQTYTFSPGTIQGTGGVLPQGSFAASKTIKFKIPAQKKAPNIKPNPSYNPIDWEWGGLTKEMEILVAKSDGYHTVESFERDVNHIIRLEAATTCGLISIYSLPDSGKYKQITTSELNKILTVSTGTGTTTPIEPGDYIAIRVKSNEKTVSSLPKIYKLPKNS